MLDKQAFVAKLLERSPSIAAVDGEKLADALIRELLAPRGVDEWGNVPGIPPCVRVPPSARCVCARRPGRGGAHVYLSAPRRSRSLGGMGWQC